MLDKKQSSAPQQSGAGVPQHKRLAQGAADGTTTPAQLPTGKGVDKKNA